ncbi:MAG: cyanoexosortase B system-associated protein [Cyanobacteria bacterium P01_A01_bin.105]
MTSTTHPSAKNRVVLAVIALLAAFIAVITLPDYLSGRWPWATPPESPHLKSLLAVREVGIALPGWQEVFKEAADFGGDQWSVQQFSQAEGAVSLEDQVVVLLRPQATSVDQPEVEWIDLMGAQRWTIDSRQPLTVATDVGTVRVNFARAWNDQQTYAIAQWYAWPNGGHPAPGHWFWGDQLRQWKQRERLSWIAVSVLLPVPPLSSIGGMEPRVEETVRLVQSALETQIFNDENDPS